MGDEKLLLTAPGPTTTGARVNIIFFILRFAIMNACITIMVPIGKQPDLEVFDGNLSQIGRVVSEKCFVLGSFKVASFKSQAPEGGIKQRVRQGL
jgi:hypothetical protein